MSFLKSQNRFPRSSAAKNSFIIAKVPSIVLLLMLLVPETGIAAENGWRIITDEHFWVSSNLTLIGNPAPGIERTSKPRDLSSNAYHRHFDEHGEAPPWGFLKPLIREVESIANLKGFTIKFHETGTERELDVASIPNNSSLAKPYLLSTVDKTYVLAVLPYYFALCKDNNHLVWVFTDKGDFRFLWRSLPTHYLKGQPHLLVAAEKAGCCESLRFSFRFYDLAGGSIREYSCPEGLCGDVLFEELEPDGPLLIGLEILAGIRGLGASLLTNLFLVGRDGVQMGSCSLLTASRSWTGSTHEFREESVVSLSSLRHVSTDREQGHGWIVEFAQGEASTTYRFDGEPMRSPPTVVYVQWDRSASTEKSEMHLNTSRGRVSLPVMGLAEEGTTSLVLENASGERRSIDIPVRTGSVQFVSLH